MAHQLVDGTRTLVAFARLLPPGLQYPQPSIGRVVTKPLVRRSGLGKQLLPRAIAELERLFPAETRCVASARRPPPSRALADRDAGSSTGIQIGAQLYLRKFYESFGFVATGDVYDEDGIDHIKMVRRVAQ